MPASQSIARSSKQLEPKSSRLAGGDIDPETQTDQPYLGEKQSRRYAGKQPFLCRSACELFARTPLVSAGSTGNYSTGRGLWTIIQGYLDILSLGASENREGHLLANTSS
ncbi:MAG: hypothetical protein QOI57_863 [Rubrobacteraceae bacterium]|nr:hypothetical protein [Rubrobacteraceae bacterium]